MRTPKPSGSRMNEKPKRPEWMTDEMESLFEETVTRIVKEVLAEEHQG